MDSDLNIVAATGYYQFKINHSKTRNLGIGKHITSPKFRVGGHDWAIVYYPQGTTQEHRGRYVSVFLQLHRVNSDAKVSISFVLLNKKGCVLQGTLKETSFTFTSHKIDCGFTRFLEINELEKYIRDDCFVLSVCIAINDGLLLADPAPHHHSTESIQHFNSKTVSKVDSSSSMTAPCEQIQRFREENKQADVTFDVAGKTFAAHRIILAAYSPVFEAELLGSMAETNMKHIEINEMTPSVFKAMLDFMYKGSLIVDADEPMSHVFFLHNLLAAADRYAVLQLKTLCENMLISSISSDTVLSTLELAEWHNCCELKEGCVRFLVDKKNSVSLMFNEGYIELMQNNPSLRIELKDLAEKCNSDKK